MEDYAPEEYTRHFIVQALFKLMQEYSYEKINVTDIVQKAGVGRATFYRYFKSKEDVITFYFDHNRNNYVFQKRFYPRCKKDYVKVVVDVAQQVFAKQATLQTVAKGKAGVPVS